MYYPKSQITSNLYSNGELIVISSGKSYIGYYYKISTGQMFSGKTPQDGPNEELSIVIDNVDDNDNAFSKVPLYSAMQPTAQNYQQGEFTRYFCKKTNEIIYIEISVETYNKLLLKDPRIYWQLYEPFLIPWSLTGKKETVASTNKNISMLIQQQKKLYNFTDYLKNDYLKYYR